MITEDYVSFETAKLLKEKGFDEKCRYVYDKNGNMTSSECFMEGESFIDNNGIELTAKYDGWNIDTQGIYAFLCPTLQMAMKWLRETYNIHVVPKYDFYAGYYTGRIYDGRRETTSEREDYIPVVGNSTYEEACEEAIKYCLKNLI